MLKILSSCFLLFIVFLVSLTSSPFCQNLYFMPGALEKMKEHGCNIKQVEEDIFKVKTWIY